MQAVRAIKFVILQGINDIEPNEPKDDCCGEHEHLEHLQAGDAAAFDGQPCSNGRQSKGETEKNMGVVRKPLGERIETNDSESERRHIKAEAIQEKTRRNQADAGKDAEGNSAGQSDLFRGLMAHSGSWIQSVELAIHDSVKSHGAGAGANHRGKN